MNLTIREVAEKKGISISAVKLWIWRNPEKAKAKGWHKNESGHWVIDEARVG